MATLGALACMLAHEMNNLLTPVLNYAQLALDAPADGKIGRRAHENAIRGVEACNAMAESILGFARRGPEGQSSLADCVAEALACLPRDLVKDGVSCRVEIERGLAAAISPTALVQIVLNLVLNARAAMPGGGELEIHAERSTWNAPRDGVRLEVRDSGHGIPPEQLGAVFEPFVSENRSGGCGLGLAICRRLLDEVGGRISVESRVGEGSVFCVELPAAVPAVA